MFDKVKYKCYALDIKMYFFSIKLVFEKIFSVQNQASINCP